MKKLIYSQEDVDLILALEKEELKEKINIKLSQNSRLLKTANMTNDIFNAIRLQAICNTYIQILEMIDGDSNDTKEL